MPNPWLRWFRPRHWKVSLTQEVKPAACPKKAQIFSSQNVPSLPFSNPDISPPSVSGPAQLRPKWPKAWTAVATIVRPQFTQRWKNMALDSPARWGFACKFSVSFTPAQPVHKRFFLIGKFPWTCFNNSLALAEQMPKDLSHDLPKSLASPFSQLCIQIFWRSDTKLSGKS